MALFLFGGYFFFQHSGQHVDAPVAFAGQASLKIQGMGNLPVAKKRPVLCLRKRTNRPCFRLRGGGGAALPPFRLDVVLFTTGAPPFFFFHPSWKRCNLSFSPLFSRDDICCLPHPGRPPQGFLSLFFRWKGSMLFLLGWLRNSPLFCLFSFLADTFVYRIDAGLLFAPSPFP